MLVKCLKNFLFSFLLQLLDYESQAADQVPLLLEMKEDKLALAKAVNSGDTDLSKSN